MGVPCNVRGDGSQTRDFVFVGDVVAALVSVLGRTGFELFHVGTGVETTVKDLYAAIREVAGTDAKPVHVPPHPGEQRRSALTSRKLEAAAGVAIATPLAQGLVPTFEWFRRRLTG
jgi:UDP-glucose 4-epimerase